MSWLCRLSHIADSWPWPASATSTEWSWSFSSSGKMFRSFRHFRLVESAFQSILWNLYKRRRRRRRRRRKRVHHKNRIRRSKVDQDVFDMKVDANGRLNAKNMTLLTLRVRTPPKSTSWLQAPRTEAQSSCKQRLPIEKDPEVEIAQVSPRPFLSWISLIRMARPSVSHSISHLYCAAQTSWPKLPDRIRPVHCPGVAALHLAKAIHGRWKPHCEASADPVKTLPSTEMNRDELNESERMD